MKVKNEATITKDLKKFQMRSVLVSGLNKSEPFNHQGFSFNPFTFISSLSDYSACNYVFWEKPNALTI
jgi:hypothetical protein